LNNKGNGLALIPLAVFLLVYIVSLESLDSYLMGICVIIAIYVNWINK